MLAFRCPQCHQTLAVAAEAAGRKVRCPRCGGVSDAPTVATPSAAGNGTSEFGQLLAPPQSAGELGRLGPYKVTKVLGRGGMGVVFAAEDLQLARSVALKVMLPNLGDSAEARSRFLREARAAAALQHDHIIPIHHVGEDRGILYLAMPLLQGESLEDRLQREGRLPLGVALRIAREIAEGLSAAHARGLVHRDIKPSNIWLEATPGRDFRVKVLDFGLARAAGEDARLTQSGAVVGTPAYMPPEQARGQVVGTRGDLFSLGCVLYRMLTGELPFRGKDTLATLAALALEHPRPVSDLNPAVPAPVAELVERLLAKDPAQRPASARAVVEELARLAEGLAAPTVMGAVRPAASEDDIPEVIPAETETLVATKNSPWRYALDGAALLLLVSGLVLVARLLWSG